MIQAARQQTASTARTPDADVRPSPATTTVAGRGALPAGLSGAGTPPSRWSLGAPNAAAEREAETAADRIGQGLRAGPLSARGGASEVRGDGATAAAGPMPQPAARALDGLSSGGGRPLSAPQMAFFGEAFSGPGRSPDTVQKSLAPVRVHTDTRASTVLEHTGAAAANVGSNVMSRPSDYSAYRPDGGPHFPHEIAHALQPGGQAGDGVVRRIITDKADERVVPPTWKSTKLTGTKLNELKAIYNTLSNPSAIFKFTKETNAEIKQNILNYVAGGETAAKFFTSPVAANITKRTLYGGTSLSSNWLSKTEKHTGNYQSYLDQHIAHILDIESGTANKSNAVKQYISAQKQQAAAEAAAADSRTATDVSIQRISDRLNSYYNRLNDALIADGQPSRRVDVTLPRFEPFHNAAEGLGLGASLTVTPYSSLAQGSSSKKDNAATRAPWEDFLDSRKFQGSVLYVRGHILNANLSGPELPINLVPLTYGVQEMLHSANDLHSTQVEEGVKNAASAILGQREGLSSVDLSQFHQRFSEVTYSVTADYTSPDKARESLRSAALDAVLAVGDQVIRGIPAPATTLPTVGAAATASAPAPNPANPDDILELIAKYPKITIDGSRSRIAPALKAVTNIANAGIHPYVLLLENAGLWDYDYRNVPRMLVIKRSAKRYIYNEDTDQLESEDVPFPDIPISNAINPSVSEYSYVASKKADKRQALVLRAKNALISHVAASAASSPQASLASAAPTLASPSNGSGGPPTASPHTPTKPSQPLANPSATSLKPVQQRTDFMSGLAPHTPTPASRPPVLPVMPQHIPPQSTSSPPPKGVPVPVGGSTGPGQPQLQFPIPSPYLQPQNSGPPPQTQVQTLGNINASPYSAPPNSNVYWSGQQSLQPQPIAGSANGGWSGAPSPYYQPQPSSNEQALTALRAAEAAAKQKASSPPGQTAAAYSGPPTQQVWGAPLQGQSQGNINAVSPPAANPFAQQSSIGAAGSGQLSLASQPTPSTFTFSGSAPDYGSQADDEDDVEDGTDSGSATGGATASARKDARKRKPGAAGSFSVAEAEVFVRLYWRMNNFEGTAEQFRQDVRAALARYNKTTTQDAGHPSGAKKRKPDDDGKKGANDKKPDGANKKTGQ